jgi:hypothetical protein
VLLTISALIAIGGGVYLARQKLATRS